MKYAVDKVEGSIVVLQNLDNAKIIEIDKINLPDDIKESDILIFDGNSYRKDDASTKSRIDLIKEKMSMLKDNS